MSDLGRIAFVLFKICSEISCAVTMQLICAFVFASYLEGSPLMWMMLLHLQVNLNADDDDDMQKHAFL